jgi:hypothetical protein
MTQGLGHFFQLNWQLSLDLMRLEMDVINSKESFDLIEKKIRFLGLPVELFFL